MSAASILELQTWIVYQRIAAECANCLCKYDIEFVLKNVEYAFIKERVLILVLSLVF